jgi:MFS family permease
MIVLIAVGVTLSVGFVLAEWKAVEPVIPLYLFRNKVFVVASIVGFMVGLSLFGSVTYLPLYLQVVKGASPTESGLQLLPLMAGVLIASIGSGQVITRTGRYKLFPVIGTALMIVGMLLLSRLAVGTSIAIADVFMLVLGLGLGFTMQVLVLVVQNAVDYANLGVATSTATLFRSMGGTIGVGIFGAVFSNRLASELSSRLPPEVAARLPARLGPAQIQALPAVVRDAYISAYAAAIRPMFLIAAGVAAAGFILTWFLPEQPLRESVADQGIRDSFATPRDISSLEELETRLALLAQHDHRHEVYDRLSAQAGLDLTAPEAWVLLRLNEGHACDGHPDLVQALRDRGLVERDGPALTDDGRAAAARLLEARCAAVEELLAGWKPDEHPDVLAMIDRFSRSLSTTPPAAAAAAV